MRINNVTESYRTVFLTVKIPVCWPGDLVHGGPTCNCFHYTLCMFVCGRECVSACVY